jgi:hypothetical protein
MFVERPRWYGLPAQLLFVDPIANRIRTARLDTAAVSRLAGEDGGTRLQQPLKRPAGLAFDDDAPRRYQLIFCEAGGPGLSRLPRPISVGDMSTGYVSGIAGYLTDFKGYRDGNGQPVGQFPQAAFGEPTGIAIAGGLAYVADAGHHTIRTVGLISPNYVNFLAGGRGSAGAAVADADRDAARFSQPAGLALAGKTLYVADTGNHCIRAIDLNAATRRVTTVAGSPGVAGGDDGAKGVARFDRPVAIAVGPDGALFVGELGTPRLRRVAPDGSVSTISGLASAGATLGDGKSASYEAITGLALDVDGATLKAIYAFDAGPKAGAGPRIVRLVPPK